MQNNIKETDDLEIRTIESLLLIGKAFKLLKKKSKNTLKHRLPIEQTCKFQ